jgi:hypothetical protein
VPLVTTAAGLRAPFTGIAPLTGINLGGLSSMVALIVLLLLLAIFDGLGFVAHVLWFVLLAALILWLLGFAFGGVDAGLGRRPWYGRW